jgi:predicted SAM-dependent methyltransferase
VDYIYCSHALEYKDFDEAREVLKEWRRVLKKDGLLRIAVPDFDQLIWLYNKKNCELDFIIGPLYGKMEINNQTKLYHKTIYNFKKIKILLESSGFKNVKRYDWKETEHSHIDDHSQAYFPHMDKENGKLISLNVESYKL